ncbi:MAG: hypothetical protein WD034_02880 [Parvibaculum sp.]|uniref:hypothetical protein n=1 Tax=Parvibaculum sp. TaxID=2024848 RepID=UPI0034A068FF
MVLSADYPTPVNVNGFACRNCTEVEQAKKNIDPAHPKSGPFGADADMDPTVPAGDARKIEAAEEKARARGENTASDKGHAGDPSKGRAVNILL